MSWFISVSDIIYSLSIVEDEELVLYNWASIPTHTHPSTPIHTHTHTDFLFQLFLYYNIYIIIL